MTLQNDSTPTTSPAVARPVAWRRTLGILAGVTALGGLAGAVQLVTGTFTPPVSDLDPLGLDSWVLPGLWLAASVAVPCAVVAVLAWRRSRRLGTAAVVAGLLLGFELVVQVPFVGPSMLQAFMGTVAGLLVGLGLLSRRAGGSR
jgi:hypothetical protein